ncbi:raptor family protein [Streptomyces sp. NBC_01340]|uniref:hypothetical protein n=1 Tax=Streptomyces sp. NBC_01340 TaxID=2903830 RepID=UPI002E0E4474|nr:raptor family protein [Streptomyces sp. NBC_01340]
MRELAVVLSRFDGLNVSEPVIDADLIGIEESWRQLRNDSVGRPRIVHFAGHGVPRGRVLYLPVHDSRPTDLPKSAIDVGRWLNEVEHGSDQSPVLFLLDVCGAGAATDYQLFQDVPEGDRRTWVIAACTADESAFGARFTKATAGALERLRLGHWDISPAPPYVPVESVADEIARELVRLGGAYPQTVLHSPRRAASLPVPEFFANPAFSTDGWQRLRSRLRLALRELASEFDPGLDPVHFLTRASGRSDDAAAMTGCLFTGRTRELTQIRSWLARDESLLLVTGRPRVGKSALLGVTLFLAHPQLAEMSTMLVSRVPAQYRPERRYPTLVAVHARHRGEDEVIASILAQLTRISRTRSPEISAVRVLNDPSSQVTPLHAGACSPHTTRFTVKRLDWMAKDKCPPTPAWSPPVTDSLRRKTCTGTCIMKPLHNLVDERTFTGSDRLSVFPGRLGRVAVPELER